jgi:hypothetical protein
MLLSVKLIEGWYYVIVAGRPDRFGYSTIAAAQRRLDAIFDGWI